METETEYLPHKDHFTVFDEMVVVVVVVVVNVCVCTRSQCEEYFLIVVPDPKWFKFIAPSYFDYHKLVFMVLNSGLILLKVKPPSIFLS